MKFRMHVDDVFKVGDKTIFAGELAVVDAAVISGKCFLQIDGIDFAEIEIKGEVQSRSPYRDLWTDQVINICSKDLIGHDVWLIAD